MAILDGVEVRVVLKATKEVLKEYNKPDSAAADEPHTIERYIEAKTGQDFQVEVFFGKDFDCGPGWGIGIDEDIDITRQDLDGQAATLGTIHIYVQSVDRIFLPEPRLRPNFYNPLTTTDVAKELVKDKHVGSVLHQSEERQASATTVEYTHQLQVPPAVGAIKTEPMKLSTNASGTTPQIPFSSSGNDEMVRKIAQLEQQLKEAQQSQERTAAMMQGFMGGFGTMMQAFAASTPPAQAAASKLLLPAAKSELVIKRERVKEEEIADNGGCLDGSRKRPVKRNKRIIELD
ncbi:MAG: hypothetical protein Q9213_005279 [Squamulea squamosa]